MLLSREEMTFDFRGAKLDPVKDRDAIAWAVQQFLYGEVTGIQVGHWIYNAPDLESARFLARQAVEEFQHVGNFLRILEILGVRPDKAAWPVRFMSTGMMGESWEEHVALEMALGEGLVLLAFYALIDTVDEPEIVSILKRGVRQEERHVDFGEAQTMKAVARDPGLKGRLVGQALVQLWAVRQLGDLMKRRLPMDHPVLGRLPEVLRHAASMTELRLMRMGLLEAPLSELPARQKLALVAESYAAKAKGALSELPRKPLRALGLFRPKRLTDTYLDDPLVKGVAGADAGAVDPADIEAEARAPRARTNGVRARA